MNQIQIKSPQDFQNLIEIKKKELMTEMESFVENEFDLFEFNIFLASFGKDKLDNATLRVSELRRKVEKKEIDLSEYEEMFN